MDYSGFGLCDMILGLGVNSGFWFFDDFRVWGPGFGFWGMILGFWGSGFSFFDTILGFGVLVFSYHIRVRGFGFLTPN